MKYMLAVMLMTMTALAFAQDNPTGTNCSGDQVASDRSSGKTVTTGTDQPTGSESGAANQ